MGGEGGVRLLGGGERPQRHRPAGAARQGGKTVGAGEGEKTRHALAAGGACEAVSRRMVRLSEDLAGEWRRLDERIEGLSNEIEVIADQDAGCDRLSSAPGIGPIISSAIVAAIGAGDVFSRGRDFAAW